MRNYIIHKSHDDVIKWKHFPRNWPFVRGIHRSPVNPPHKGQWRGALMFSLICVWINDWVNNREAGDLRRYRAHYDVSVMQIWHVTSTLERHSSTLSFSVDVSPRYSVLSHTLGIVKAEFSQFSIYHGPLFHDIAYNTTVKNVKYRSDFDLTEAINILSPLPICGVTDVGCFWVRNHTAI